MANSLMELYGGGMTGKSTNYQLGGRIAKASRDRQRDSELRILEQLAERAAAEKRRRGLVSGAIKFGANLLQPGLGDVLGGVYDAQYQKQDYGDTKYAGREVERLEAAEDAYKEGIPQRAILGAVQANIMGDFYQDLREKGLDKFNQLTGDRLARDFGIGAEGFAERVTEKGIADNPSLRSIEEVINPSEESLLNFLPAEDIPVDIPSVAPLSSPVIGDTAGLLGDIELSDIPETTLADFNPILPMENQPRSNFLDFSRFLQPTSAESTGVMFRGGGLLNMLTPTMQVGGMVDRFGMDDFEEGGVGMTNPLPSPPPPPPTSPATSQPLAYGTAMDPLLALRQIGFSDIADDPRLQQYLSDLPQFGMGYAQQLGDIQTAGQSNLANLRGQATQMAGQSGFAASGAGQRQMASALDSLRTDTARQRRGVIEGFQGDLLSAIRDIEQTAGFNFGVNSVTNPDVQSPEDILKADPTKTLEEAREEYEEMRARDERRMYG